MADPILFDDGAAYERSMGGWSQLAGRVFLDWLAPAPGQRWIDVGCGNGAFTELAMQRCSPAAMLGVDPSEGQIRFARSRPGAQGARFEIGGAQALPAADASVDVAAMALVIFFVDEPGRAVAEMRRVVRPGGVIAAYAWNIIGGGLPHEPVQAELRARGFTPMLPPQVAVAQRGPLRSLWDDAGLIEVRQREIAITRTFESFEAVLETVTGMTSLAGIVARFSSAERDSFRSGLRARLPAADGAGRITCSARAEAIAGRVPG